MMRTRSGIADTLPFLSCAFLFLSVLKLITFSVAVPLQNREAFAQNKRDSWGFISANGPFKMGGERDLFQISCFKAIPINETGDLATIDMLRNSTSFLPQFSLAIFLHISL